MDATVLDQLFETISSRKGADPSESYTAKLFSKGRGKIAQKVGEEGVECVIAALSEGNDALTSESADLFYHLLVLWAEAGVDPQDVWNELARREGISGITEKNSRPKE
ncbi:phosphoribosyl-ATP diphosphatase [Terasakiella sp. A23]|uniref:phosphoribosyl-ATP diphosphatase n=1 Tax=Terasakiella sp. FCG-A23 TaxID=3080561 RepID=UPI0029531983|nr:phosphoribosyl-ATP diphosphatase [Terasakiella sp. A23]MDV7341691.1 phosphoribosyl-ATP diphosphatase [Terasakiella sp. A23]